MLQAVCFAVACSPHTRPQAAVPLPVCARLSLCRPAAPGEAGAPELPCTPGLGRPPLVILGCQSERGDSYGLSAGWAPWGPPRSRRGVAAKRPRVLVCHRLSWWVPQHHLAYICCEFWSKYLT